MSFPAYPEYKDSGVGWLGEIPAGWEPRKFRFLFAESAEKIDDTVVGPMLAVSGYRGIEVKEYEDDNQRRSDDDLVGYRIVRPGQLVVNTMWLNYTGLGVSEHEGHVSPAYRSYDISESLDRRFVHYIMRSSIHVDAYTRLLQGIRPNSLQMSRADLMDFPVLVPPADDQRAIAAFLDRETAKIDAAVAAQERLIALLAEKRAATISHAVTKGLDPDAPMKDSGIEWLGQIPAHWSTPAISHVCDEIGSGTTPSTNDEQAYGGEVCWVTTGELRETGIYSTRKRLTEAALANYSALKKFSPGTLLIAMYGATIGRLGWLECEAATNQACCAMRTSEPDLGRFLFYVLQGGKPALILLGSGGGQPNISQEKVRQFRFALPSHEEQKTIIAYLDNACSRIDALKAKALSSIRLLKERRAALISAAVTGKIDVRGDVDE
ncbi:restriction endonuclease subunit S [Qipengyuania sp. GPGPB31]|uniref:restriction endonuclease subunit S n=1 Tax=Qipengyuania sp. GPGPB31 TaxID=3023518 RepID=UPI0031345161